MRRVPVTEIGCVVVAELAALRLDPPDQLLRVLRALLVLDPGVKVFGVLADNDQVDVVEARAHTAVAFARPDLGVHVELLAERHVHGAEAAADWRGDRALQRDTGFTDGVQHCGRKRISAVAVHHIGPGFLHVPLELDAGRLEDPACRLGQLGAGSVAWNEDYAVRHGPNLPTGPLESRP